MDNYTNDDRSYGGSHGYPVDPDNNSYSYTGTDGASDNSYSSGSSYSSYSSYSSAQAGSDQNHDRYYSPYERRTMGEGTTEKKPKKQHGFGVTVAKCACLAAVFGLVAGGVFGGVNYVLTPEKETAVTETQVSALATTSQDNENTAAHDINGSIIVTDVSDVVEDTMPAIVAITNMTENQYRTWFGQTYTQEDDYAGSGIIVSEDDDYLYIATNNHVVEGATTLTVQFCDESTVAAEVKGVSPSNDLSVVKVRKDDIEDETKEVIKIAKINDSGNEKVGQSVIAIGNALGYGQSVTSGIISALNREVTAQDSSTGVTYTNTLTQTDASINPGNSGGALLNTKGEVIGINSSKMGGDYVDGVGFAIPMTTAAPIINELITREKVTEDKAASLGINAIDVDDSVSEQYGMPSGICVVKVYAGSAAANAGIQKGDIITKFDGHSVRSMDEIGDLLQYHAAGTKVTVTVSRADDGQYVERDVEVTLDSKN